MNTDNLRELRTIEEHQEVREQRAKYGVSLYDVIDLTSNLLIIIRNALVMFADADIEVHGDSDLVFGSKETVKKIDYILKGYDEDVSKSHDKYIKSIDFEDVPGTQYTTMKTVWKFDGAEEKYDEEMQRLRSYKDQLSKEVFEWLHDNLGGLWV